MPTIAVARFAVCEMSLPEIVMLSVPSSARIPACPKWVISLFWKVRLLFEIAVDVPDEAMLLNGITVELVPRIMVLEIELLSFPVVAPVL